MSNYLQRQDTATRAPTIEVNDELGRSITAAIDHLASDGSLYTRWRLRGARSRGAIKLAETALVESM